MILKTRGLLKIWYFIWIIHHLLMNHRAPARLVWSTSCPPIYSTSQSRPTTFLPKLIISQSIFDIGLSHCRVRMLRFILNLPWVRKRLLLIIKSLWRSGDVTRSIQWWTNRQPLCVRWMPKRWAWTSVQAACHQVVTLLVQLWSQGLEQKSGIPYLEVKSPFSPHPRITAIALLISRSWRMRTTLFLQKIKGKVWIRWSRTRIR